jgi:hypothetical protein
LICALDAQHETRSHIIPGRVELGGRSIDIEPAPDVIFKAGGRDRAPCRPAPPPVAS